MVKLAITGPPPAVCYGQTGYVLAAQFPTLPGRVSGTSGTAAVWCRAHPRCRSALLLRVGRHVPRGRLQVLLFRVLLFRIAGDVLGEYSGFFPLVLLSRIAGDVLGEHSGFFPLVLLSRVAGAFLRDCFWVFLHELHRTGDSQSFSQFEDSIVVS